MKEKKLIFQDEGRILNMSANIQNSLPILKQLSKQIRPFLGNMTTEMFQKALHDPESLKSQYMAAVEAEAQNLKLSTPTARANIMAGAKSDINTILSVVEENKAELFEIADFIVFENGEPVFTEQKKKELIEKFRIYVQSEIGLEAYRLHIEAIEAFNKFWSFSKNNLRHQVTLYGNLTISGTFAKYDQKTETFTPALLNYDSLINPEKH